MSDHYAAYSRLTLDYPSKRILRLTFNRPETYNSVDAETHTQLTNIWRDINADPNINAVIVTGAGKAFSAGGDFELIKSVLESSVARMATWKEAKDLVYNVINCNKPIISAINGVAVGAGLVVGILADVSIAGKSARIVDGHTRLGVAAGDVACIIWPLLCGLAKAKYYLLTCKPLSGEEAERIGLVSLCVEDSDLQKTALDVAEDLSNGAQSAIRWTKYALNNWLRVNGPLFDTSTALEMLGFAGEEAREGLTSLLEKREPIFPQDCPLQLDHSKHEGETIKADPAINPNGLLPRRLAYYRYPGSLTTPPCSETVEWLLLTDPIQVAEADIASFAKLYAMNARPAQNVNRRDVLRSG